MDADDPAAAGAAPAIDTEGMEKEGRDWVARIPAPPALFKFVIGKGGSKKREIEDASGARVVIPRRGAPDDAPIVIRGRMATGVRRAVTAVELVLEECRRKADYTHFVSVPVTAAAAEVEALQARLLGAHGPGSAAPAAGLDRSVSMYPQQLHMTLLMLRLLTRAEVEAAGAALQACAADLRAIAAEAGTEGGGPCVRLHGLEYMNDDPSEVNVLYLGVRDDDAHPGGRAALVRMGARVAEEMVARGIVDEAELTRQRMRDPSGRLAPKLHVTLFNTRLRGRGGDARVPLDARPLLAAAGPGGAGVGTSTAVAVGAVHLSRRGHFDESGYFEAETVVRLRRG